MMYDDLFDRSGSGDTDFSEMLISLLESRNEPYGFDPVYADDNKTEDAN